MGTLLLGMGHILSMQAARRTRHTLEARQGATIVARVTERMERVHGWVVSPVRPPYDLVCKSVPRIAWHRDSSAIKCEEGGHEIGNKSVSVHLARL